MSHPQLLDLDRAEFATQDAILQYISSNFVSVKPSDKKYYKSHLLSVVEKLIEKMKEVDKFFCKIFQRDCVAGSFWDGLKIGKPVEFDKNFILRLPTAFKNHLEFKPASPSYVLINIAKGLSELKKSGKWEEYRKIEDWLDRGGNIISDKVRFWIESVVDKAIKSLPEINKRYLMETRHSHDYLLGSKKSGPAITVDVEIRPDNRKFELDIVPAFEFGTEYWPNHIRQYPLHISDKLWHVVPKPLKPDENKSHIEDGQIYPPFLQWRLSFHHHESKIIHNTFHLKPVLKLIKKLRDVKLDQNMLCSYAIKTIFLSEMDVQGNGFWKTRLTNSFLHMLYVLVEKLENGAIPFYWDEGQNLLGKLKPSQREQVHNTILKVYNRISHSLASGLDHYIIAKELLTNDEFDQLLRQVKIVDGKLTTI